MHGSRVFGMIGRLRRRLDEQTRLVAFDSPMGICLNVSFAAMRANWVYHRCCSVYRACGRRWAMKHLMPFVVALVCLTGATLRTQGISASTQPKLPAGQRALAGRQITAEQLEQMLAAVNREPDKELAKQLSELELTERLSAARLTRCEANLPGPDARRALRALADRSSFLDPPASEIPA